MIQHPVLGSKNGERESIPKQNDSNSQPENSNKNSRNAELVSAICNFAHKGSPNLQELVNQEREENRESSVTTIQTLFDLTTIFSGSLSL